MFSLFNQRKSSWLARLPVVLFIALLIGDRRLTAGQDDPLISKKLSELVLKLPAKRDIGSNKRMLNDLRLAMFYNDEWIAIDKASEKLPHKGLLVFVVIESYSKRGILYYQTFTHSVDVDLLDEIINGHDFLSGFCQIVVSGDTAAKYLSRSVFRINLAPGSSSTVDTPVGQIAFAGPLQFVSTIQFGYGIWQSPSGCPTNSPDTLAQGIPELVKNVNGFSSDQGGALTNPSTPRTSCARTVSLRATSGYVGR